MDDLKKHPGSMVFEIAKRTGIKGNAVKSNIYRLKATDIIIQKNGGYYVE